MNFHHQSNGKIESFHCSLKKALCAPLAGSDLLLHLPLILPALCSVPKKNKGFAVSEAVFWTPLTVPGEFLGGSELPHQLSCRRLSKLSPDLPFLHLIMFTRLHQLSSSSTCLPVSESCVCSRRCFSFISGPTISLTVFGS